MPGGWRRGFRAAASVAAGAAQAGHGLYSCFLAGLRQCWRHVQSFLSLLANYCRSAAGRAEGPCGTAPSTRTRLPRRLRRSRREFLCFNFSSIDRFNQKVWWTRLARSLPSSQQPARPRPGSARGPASLPCPPVGHPILVIKPHRRHKTETAQHGWHTPDESTAHGTPRQAPAGFRRRRGLYRDRRQIARRVAAAVFGIPPGRGSRRGRRGGAKRGPPFRGIERKGESRILSKIPHPFIVPGPGWAC